MPNEYIKLPVESGSGSSITIGAPANGLSLAGSALSLALSSVSTTGALSSTDWSTFNGKQPAGSYALTTRTISTTSPLAGGGDLSADRTFSIPAATSLVNGYLSSTDWSTFNSKQPAGSYLTALSSDVSASGPGSAAATVNSVGGSSATNINLATIAAIAATDLNTISTIVKRDGSGGFQAGIVKLLSDTYQFGTLDPFSRSQIWNKAASNVLRLGSWSSDGDPTDVISEGSIFYGNSLTGQPLNTANGSYARIKPNRFGFFTIDSTLPAYAGAGDYYWRVDNTQMYFKNNLAIPTFSVQRITGDTTTTGTLSASNLSGTNTGDVSLTTANGLSLLGQALSLGLSSALTTGALSSTDWSTFNGKQPAGSYVTANGAITGATNTKISYDSKGLITSGAQAAASDISNDSGITGSTVKTALDNLVSKYGEMYFYTATGGASTSMAMDTTLLYHGVVLTTIAPTLKGFTHKIGQANNIASVADNSGVTPGTILVTTTGAHNLAVGDYVTHTGFTTQTTYRGKYRVLTTPLTTTYTVTRAFVATDTGFMKRACSLTVSVGSAGKYRAAYSITLTAAANNKNIKIELNTNTSDNDNIAAETNLLNTNLNMNSAGIITLADGDTIWPSIANTTDAVDILIRDFNLNLFRIDV